MALAACRFGRRHGIGIGDADLVDVPLTSMTFGVNDNAWLYCYADAHAGTLVDAAQLLGLQPFANGDGGLVSIDHPRDAHWTVRIGPSMFQVMAPHPITVVAPFHDDPRPAPRDWRKWAIADGVVVLLLGQVPVTTQELAAFPATFERIVSKPACLASLKIEQVDHLGL